MDEIKDKRHQSKEWNTQATYEEENRNYIQKRFEHLERINNEQTSESEMNSVIQKDRFRKAKNKKVWSQNSIFTKS